jgi:hypothetical protein
MKRICFFLIVLFSVISWSAMGQITSGNVSGELEKLFGRMKDPNNNDKVKLIINDSIRLIIENYAGSDSVFKHKFSNLRYLGQINSPDSLVKIITWNLILEDSINQYSCYIIRRWASGKGSRVFKLNGIYKQAPILPDTIYSQTDWYGALYYDIRPFTFNNEVSYALLGIDYGNIYTTRKIIDVLSFSSLNEIVLGKKCFIPDKKKESRVIFEFASSAVMTLRFLTDTSIVFDHLSPFTPELKGNHQFYGPDYSYDAFIFENGYWRLKTNVDVRNKD